MPRAIAVLFIHILREFFAEINCNFVTAMLTIEREEISIAQRPVAVSGRRSSQVSVHHAPNNLEGGVR